jgi:hypothetical protein
MTEPAAVPARECAAILANLSGRPFHDDGDLTAEQRAILALLDRVEALERELSLLRRNDPTAIFRSDAMRIARARRTT